MPSSCYCRSWRGLHRRANAGFVWISDPGDYATFNSNHTPDGTLPYGEGRHAPIAAEDQARLIAAILAQPAAHLGKTYPLHGPIELDQAGIAAAVSEVLGRTISYRPLTIPQYRERLEKAGLPEFMIQHFCAIAVDYQNGIFSGEDKIIAEVTGQPPMTVQQFASLHCDAFKLVRPQSD
jgi:NAD(P)H dehydrogenase (quinone)